MLILTISAAVVVLLMIWMSKGNGITHENSYEEFKYKQQEKRERNAKF